MTSYSSKSHRWKSWFLGGGRGQAVGRFPSLLPLSAAMNWLLQVLWAVPYFCPVYLYWLSSFTDSLKSTPQQAILWHGVPGS